MKYKLIIFGTGQFLKNREDRLRDYEEIFQIVGYIDNNTDLHGSLYKGNIIYDPNVIKTIEYDYILLMSKSHDEMRTQLRLLGVDETDIICFSELPYFLEKDYSHTYFGKSFKRVKEKILFVTTDMDYGGGTLVALYAVQALQEKGYDVVMTTPSIDEKLLKEIRNKINIKICPTLPFIFKDDKWYEEYDVIFVNVFQMINCAYRLSKVKPVIWWIHESASNEAGHYQRTISRYPELSDAKWMDRVYTVGVSRIAQRSFNSFYPDVIQTILMPGIIDEQGVRRTTDDSKLTIAILGPVYPLKNQKLLLEAVQMLKDEAKKKVRLWVIGRLIDSSYCHDVENIVCTTENVEIMGLKTRKEIQELMKQIDVIVCASKEETLSLTIIEGMMHQKVCLTTANTGIADFIAHKKNGLICKTQDVEDLAEKLTWIIEHPAECKTIAENARETYEKYFTIEKFGERLEDIINRTLRKC